MTEGKPIELKKLGNYISKKGTKTRIHAECPFCDSKFVFTDNGNPYENYHRLEESWLAHVKTCSTRVLKMAFPYTFKDNQAFYDGKVPRIHV